MKFLCLTLVSRRRFSELNAFVFDAKFLLALGLSNQKKWALARGQL